MYHSITIGNKNTWEDWGLVPTSRPVFNPPIPEIRSDDNSLKNGTILGTEIITPRHTLLNREGDIEFYVYDQRWNWSELYSEIMNYLHGFKMTAVLEDDPLYCYKGRFFISDWQSNEDYSTITISYSLDPYKYLLSDQSVKEI